MKNARASFPASMGAVFLALSVLAEAQPQPVRPSFDVKKLQEESRLIHENAKGDPKKLLEDLNAFNKRTAAALGPEYEAWFNEEQRLQKKYGPVGGSINRQKGTWADPATSDTIDLHAWITTVQKDGEGLIVSAKLDPRRYADVTPTSVVFQLVEKQSARENPFRFVDLDPANPIVTLRYELKDGTYTLTQPVPIVDRDRLVVQVFGGIEPRWSTLTTVDLTDPGTRVRPPRPEPRLPPAPVRKQP